MDSLNIETGFVVSWWIPRDDKTSSFTFRIKAKGGVSVSLSFDPKSDRRHLIFVSFEGSRGVAVYQNLSPSHFNSHRIALGAFCISWYQSRLRPWEIEMHIS